MLNTLKNADKMAVVCELRGITVTLFGRIRDMCWLVSSVPSRISTVKVSATKNIDLTGRSSIVT